MKEINLKERFENWVDGNENLDFLEQYIKIEAEKIAGVYDKDLYHNDEDRTQAEIDYILTYKEELRKLKELVMMGILISLTLEKKDN